MKTVSLIIPYFGKMNEYQLFAIRQLSLVSCLDINLIIDRDFDELSLSMNGVNILDSKDCFIEDNCFGLKLSELYEFPYKLCDLKPFFNLIFKFEHKKYYSFCDLDCIYNPSVLRTLLSDIPDRFIGGENGHFMIFDFLSLFKVQNDFIVKALTFKKSNDIDLFVGGRHFALDEYLFLHKVLSELDSNSEIFWNRDFFKPFLDVDYKNLIPVNWFESDLSFSIDSILVDMEISDSSYIHLQKRKLSGPLLNNNTITFNKLGHVVLNTSENKKIYLSYTAIFRCRCFWERVKFRFRHHGLSKRPSFT